MAKFLLFDLDGTLCDTHALHRGTWFEVLRPHGIEVDLDFYQRKLRGRTSKQIIKDLLPDLSDDEAERLVEAESRSYRNRAMKAGPLVGLPDFMEEARRRGLGLSLVSNAPKENTHESLQSLGLEGTFEPIVLAEDVGAAKPDPSCYHAALKQAGVSPEAGLAFEDSPTGITAAVKAGIPAVGLVTTHSPEELREAGAAALIGDYADPMAYEVLESPEPQSR